MNTLKTILETDTKYADLKTKVDNILADELITSPTLALALKRLNAKLDSNKNIKTNKRSDGPIPSRLLNELTRNVNVLYNRLNKIKNSNNKITKPRGRPSRSSKTVTPSVAPTFEPVPTYDAPDAQVVFNNNSRTIVAINADTNKDLLNGDVIQKAINLINNTTTPINTDINIRFMMMDPKHINEPFNRKNLIPAGIVSKKIIPNNNTNIHIDDKFEKISIFIPQDESHDISGYIDDNLNNPNMWVLKIFNYYGSDEPSVSSQITSSILNSKIPFDKYSPILYIDIITSHNAEFKRENEFYALATEKVQHCVYSPIEEYFKNRLDTNPNSKHIKSSLNKLSKIDFSKPFPIQKVDECQAIVDNLKISIVVLDRTFTRPINYFSPKNIKDNLKTFVYCNNRFNHVDLLKLNNADVNIRTFIDNNKLKQVKVPDEQLYKIFNENKYTATRYVNASNGQLKKVIVDMVLYTPEITTKNPFNAIVKQIHPDFNKYRIQTVNNPIYDFIKRALVIGGLQTFTQNIDIKGLEKQKQQIIQKYAKDSKRPGVVVIEKGAPNLFEQEYNNIGLFKNAENMYTMDCIEIDHAKDYINYADCEFYNTDFGGLPTVLSNLISYNPPLTNNDIQNLIYSNEFNTGFYMINNVILPFDLHPTIRSLDYIKNNCVYPSVELALFLKLNIKFNVIMSTISKHNIKLDFNAEQLATIQKRENTFINDEGVTFESGNRYYCTGLGAWGFNYKTETKELFMPLEYGEQAVQEYAESLKYNNPDCSIDYHKATGLISINKPIYSHLNHSHMYAFITTYSRINLINQILKFKPNEIVGVRVDCLYLTKSLSTDYINKQANKNYIIKSIKRVTETPKNRRAFMFNSINDEQLTNNFIPYSISVDNEFMQHDNILLSGQGGAGKTHKILHTFKSSSILLLLPSNQLAQNKHIEIQTAIKNGTLPSHTNIQCRTYSSLGLGEIPIGKFNKDNNKPIFIKPHNVTTTYYDIIAADEITLMSSTILKELRNNFGDKCNKMIFMGDLEINNDIKRITYYQIENMDKSFIKISDNKTMATSNLLRYGDFQPSGIFNSFHQIQLTTNYRFLPNDHIINVTNHLRDNIKNKTSYNHNNLINEWISSGYITQEHNTITSANLPQQFKHQSSIILTSRITCSACKNTGVKCCLGDACTAMCSRYTNLLWDKDNVENQKFFTIKSSPSIGGEQYFKSMIINKNIGATCIPRLSYTIHSFQGITIPSDTIYIDLVGSNLQTLYTSISRAKSISQVVFII